MIARAIWSLKRGHIDEAVEMPDDAEAYVNRVIGFRMAQIRHDRGKSREALGRILGVHRNTIMRWEQGDCGIPSWALYAFCCVVDCSPSVLLRLIDPPTVKAEVA